MTLFHILSNIFSPVRRNVCATVYSTITNATFIITSQSNSRGCRYEEIYSVERRNCEYSIKGVQEMYVTINTTFKIMHCVIFFRHVKRQE